MKTSRFRSSLGCCFCKALRPAVTSGRSCSAARRLFFKAQIQMMQESGDRRLTDRHLLLRQKGLDLCQRDIRLLRHQLPDQFLVRGQSISCLLYTSDAADDLLCVDLGGRRIIKKKKTNNLLER